MFDELTKNPLITGMLYALLIALGGWLTALITRRRQRSDLESELEKVRLQAEIDAAKRAEVTRVEIERAKVEAALAQKVIADALAKTTEEQRLAAKEVKEKLDQIALVADKTHELTNSAKTNMERVEQELRNQIDTIRTAASTAALAATTALAAAKELATKDLLAEKEKIAMLTQQLASMLPTPSVAAVAAVAAGVPAGAQVVTVPEQVLPVEDARTPPRILQP